MTDIRTIGAIDIMPRPALRTGLNSDRSARYYLWTDAIAVTNFIGLAQKTKHERFTQLALQLIDQVHHTLGRHRDDNPRTGWISGLTEAQREVHPIMGGLRIGKRYPERGKKELVDEQLEWDRDGQYFYHLTKWIRALGLESLQRNS